MHIKSLKVHQKVKKLSRNRFKIFNRNRLGGYKGFPGGSVVRNPPAMQEM